MIDISLASMFINIIDFIILPIIIFMGVAFAVLSGNYIFRKCCDKELEKDTHECKVAIRKLSAELGVASHDIGVLFAAIEPMVNIYRTDPLPQNEKATSKRRGRKKGSKNKHSNRSS